MLNRRSATTYHIVGSLSFLAGMALTLSATIRGLDSEMPEAWSRVWAALFGPMGDVGLFFAYGIAVAGGFFSIWVLDIPRRLGNWYPLFLSSQFLAATLSLAVVMRLLIFPLGLGGYGEPLVEGIALHLILLTAGAAVWSRKLRRSREAISAEA